MHYLTTIFNMLLLFTLTACDTTTYQSSQEKIVSHILKSQDILIHAYENNASTLDSAEIEKFEGYHHTQNQEKGVDAIDIQLARLSLYHDKEAFTLQDLHLDWDRDAQTYAYDYQGYLYDDYGRVTFQSTYTIVGKAQQHPHKGEMTITGDKESIVMNIINKDDIVLHIYNHYDSYHDKTIYTDWKSLGF